MVVGMPLSVIEAGEGFEDWEVLLGLIRRAFAGMDGRIDPPSSAWALTPARLAEMALEGPVLLARGDNRILGCAFLRRDGDALYVGKLAVEPDRQCQGIGRWLIDTAAEIARRRGLCALELKTRVELTENHRAFGAMGFRKVGENRHEGYERTTSITMRLELDQTADVGVAASGG